MIREYLLCFGLVRVLDKLQDALGIPPECSEFLLDSKVGALGGNKSVSIAFKSIGDADMDLTSWASVECENAPVIVARP
jgi:hypothetical protein